MKQQNESQEKRRVPEGTRVNCIVAGCCEARFFRYTLDTAVCRSLYPHMTLTVCTGYPADADTERYCAALSATKAAKVVRAAGETNLALLYNSGAEKAREEALLFLPPGMAFSAGHAVSRMLETAMRPDTGAVTGVVRAAFDGAGAAGKPSALPLMVRRSLFFEVGCFDETFPQAGFAHALLWTLAGKRLVNRAVGEAIFALPAPLPLPPVTEKNRERMKDLRFTLEREAEAKGENG